MGMWIVEILMVFCFTSLFLMVFCFYLADSDLSVWCFACDAYLDAQVIQKLRVAYETAYILKFGEAPPVRTVECMQLEDTRTGNSC